jgi:hypothetical protein
VLFVGNVRRELLARVGARQCFFLVGAQSLVDHRADVDEAALIFWPCPIALAIVRFVDSGRQCGLCRAILGIPDFVTALSKPVSRGRPWRIKPAHSIQRLAGRRRASS